MKKIHERKRAKQTGKGAAHSFIMLPHFVVRSPEFIRLDASAVKLFMHFAGQFNGHNNGDFAIVENRYADAGFSGREAVQKAKKALLDSKFAVMTRQGHKRKCSLFALTIWPVDACDGKHEWPTERKASHAWRTEISVDRQAVQTWTAERSKTTQEAA